jgi:hypothetical protein
MYMLRHDNPAYPWPGISPDMTAIEDTHKTDAELSVLSSGDEVRHWLPDTG